MATRRLTPAPDEKNEASPAGGHTAASDIRPAVPTSVIAKLLGFTFAMVTFPLGSYFLSVNTIFGGNATSAGALAAAMANVVLIGYVIVAFNDDKSEREAEEAQKKKMR